MSRLFAGFPRRRGVYAVAIVLLGAFLVLLLAFLAPKPYIEAQIELRGWNREGGAAVSVSVERGVSLDWVTGKEALLAVVAPRDALITVSSEEGAVTFTIHELIMYTEREWMAAEGNVQAGMLSAKVMDWTATQD